MAEGTCSLCKRVLPASSFYQRSPGVLRKDCKECVLARNARWRECNQEAYRATRRRSHIVNREQNNARSQQWREAHPAANAAIKKRSYEKKRDVYLARMKAYRQANPDLTRAITLAWREAHPQAVRSYNRNYRARKKQADPDGYLAAARVYAKKQRQAAPTIYREYERKYRAKKRQAAIGLVTPDLLAMKFAYWGWACWLCGGEPTQVDHVKPLNKGGAHCLANLRPICKPCNSGKCDTWPFPTHRRR